MSRILILYYVSPQPNKLLSVINRMMVSKLKMDSQSLAKGEGQLKYFLAIITRLIEEERSWPLEDQFP